MNRRQLLKGALGIGAIAAGATIVPSTRTDLSRDVTWSHPAPGKLVFDVVTAEEIEGGSVFLHEYKWRRIGYRLEPNAENDTYRMVYFNEEVD